MNAIRKTFSVSYLTGTLQALITLLLSAGFITNVIDAQEKKPQEKSDVRPLFGSQHGVKKGGVVYSSGKGKQGKQYELKLDVYVPNGKGPFPTVLAVHGGAWRSGAKWHMIRHAWKFVEQGYCVVAINYRHAPDHKFPAQIHDVKDAVRFMRMNQKEYKIDGEKIVAFGYSAGGHLVSLLGTTAVDDGHEGKLTEENKKISTRVRAVVAGGAPCEFSWIGRNSGALHYWMGKTRAKDPEHWKRASPITFVSRDDPPFMFLHAEKDTVVPPSTSAKMEEALKKAKVPTQRKIYKGHGHISLFSNLDIVDDMVVFYDEVLKIDRSKKSTAGRKGQ